jgi:hypothetical protein
MSKISITNLQPIGDEYISPLSVEDMESIAGGNIAIYGGPIVVGFAVGTAIRMGIDAFVDWLFD